MIKIGRNINIKREKRIIGTIKIKRKYWPISSKNQAKSSMKANER